MPMLGKAGWLGDMLVGGGTGSMARMDVRTSLALPFMNAGVRSGGVEGVARLTLCNDNTETVRANRKGKTHNLASPHHKFGTVENPMRILIGEAVFLRVGLTCPNRVLPLETLRDLVDRVVKSEL